MQRAWNYKIQISTRNPPTAKITTTKTGAALAATHTTGSDQQTDRQLDRWTVGQLHCVQRLVWALNDRRAHERQQPIINQTARQHFYNNLQFTMYRQQPTLWIPSRSFTTTTNGATCESSGNKQLHALIISYRLTKLILKANIKFILDFARSYWKAHCTQADWKCVLIFDWLYVQ